MSKDVKSDIKIVFVNNTGETDIQVLVYTKNYSMNTTDSYYCAWRTIRAQNKSEFVYPVQIEIGAWFYEGNQKTTSGPFAAKLGSTWNIKQEQGGTAVMLEDKSAQNNPNNTIVIKNLHPVSSWGGRKFDVGVYKDGQVLVVEKDLHIKSQVDFTLQPKLFFDVIGDIQVGDIFTSMKTTATLTEFDLSKYPDGIQVTLNEKPGDGGEYYFQGDSLSGMLDA